MSAHLRERITSYTHDGLVFDVVDDGPLDGDVVVLLHGFPERATSWQQVAARLHAHGFRTLAPDQRGYSPGARPPRRRDHRLALLTADVAALVERVGGPVHLVGHDWGAIVAWSLAQTRPELLRTLTAFSVPHPGAFARSMRGLRQPLRSWYVGVFQVRGLAERVLARPGLAARVLRRGGMTPEDVEAFRAGIVEHGALRGGLMWYRALGLLDRDQVPRHVTVPTTMVWSDGDSFLDRSGVEATERYVDASYELVVLSGVTHWIPTQAPDAAAEAVLERISGT